MLSDPQAFLEWLKAAGIEVETHWHPPVFTVEEAELHTAHLPGGHTKNLFIEDRKGGLWLVTCLDRQTVKVNALARLLEAPRFSFAAPERLREILGVEPGSVTPFALVNDRDRLVTPVLDAKMLACEALNFHPLSNTGTCTIRTADFRRFIAGTGHTPIELDLDATLAA
jgi:Ala-tRNA(Pro) deacylase